jgi:DNA invertase Pin-like site-specific DNA recombinase
MTGAAVVYAAKSTEDKRGSIPTQLAEGRAMAECEGWTVVGEYQDENESAYHGSRGDGLARAKAHAEGLVAEGQSVVLIVQHSDRLARGDGGKRAAHLVEFSLWRAKSGVEIRSVQDDATWTTPMGHLIPALMGERNFEDSRRKGLAVRAGMKREAERGKHNGRTPYGYRRKGRGADSTLVAVPAQAAVVRKVYADYVAGMSVREISRALNEAGTPPPRNADLWVRSVVGRMLANVVYVGRLRATGEDGEHLPGSHPALVDEDVWLRARAIRAGNLKRQPGRLPDEGHLLVKGTLRCHCGAAMKPTKARQGSRSTYWCSGRIEHGEGFCSQRGIPRERVDEPFLAAVLDRHVDLQATRERIAERASAALSRAQDAVAERGREAATAEARLARVRDHYREGRIDAETWAEERADLTAAVDGAQAALAQAQANAARLEQEGPAGDAEQELFEQLAAIRAAVADGVGSAPSLNALRNTIAALFERVQLVRADDLSPLKDYRGEGVVDLTDHEGKLAVPEVAGGYLLLPVIRGSAFDVEAVEPLRQPLPIASSPLGATP